MPINDWKKSTAILKELRTVKGVFSSTSIGIDVATGWNGIPMGSFIRIWGGEGTGKSSLMQRIAQRYMEEKQRRVFYFDFEVGLTQTVAEWNGLDWENELFTPVDGGALSLESASDLILKILDDPTCKESLFIIDTFDAAMPEVEQDGDIGSGYAAKKIAIAAQFYRKLITSLYNTQSSLIQVHQAAAAQGENAKYLPFGTVSGGYKTNHYLQLDIALRESEQIKDADGNKTGNEIAWIIDKNRHGKRYIKGKYRFTQENNIGIDTVAETLDVALLFGLVKRSGAFYQFTTLEGQPKLQGEAKAVAYLREDKARVAALQEAIKYGKQETSEQSVEPESEPESVAPF